MAPKIGTTTPVQIPHGAAHAVKLLTSAQAHEFEKQGKGFYILVGDKNGLKCINGREKRTLNHYTLNELRQGDNIGQADGHAIRRAGDHLRLGAAFVLTAGVALLVGYLISEHWFRNRLANPYGYGGYGYGGY